MRGHLEACVTGRAAHAEKQNAALGRMPASPPQKANSGERLGSAARVGAWGLGNWLLCTSLRVGGGGALGGDPGARAGLTDISLDFGSTGVQAELERQPAEVPVGRAQDAAWPCLVLSTEPDGVALGLASFTWKTASKVWVSWERPPLFTPMTPWLFTG